MNDAATSEQADYRVFGITLDGQLRANLHNSAAAPDAGALYSWIVGTEEQVAEKLRGWYDQPISAEEWDFIEQLEAETEADAMACEDCGGTGRDPGSLNPIEAEDCRSCFGTGRETPLVARRPARRQGVNVPVWQEVA
jgi:hypothetical protein